MPRSISVIVPALNEERGLERTVRMVDRLLPQYFSDWEILVWDDGSRDDTPRIADRLAAQSDRIRAFHNPYPRNLGACYKAGLKASTKEFVLLIPGDGECGAPVLEAVLPRAGEADVIIPYPLRVAGRGWARRFLSVAFVRLLNVLSGLRLKYYNGPVLHRTELVRGVPIRTDGFGYQAELLLQLLRAGASFLEVPIPISARLGGRSKALHPKNILSVGWFLIRVAKCRALDG